MKREQGIDAVRLLMALTVVLLHSMPTSPGIQYSALSVICRAAVPFFLIASGYFIRPSTAPTSAMVTRPLAKLGPVYVFWMLVYYGVAASTGVAEVRLSPTDIVSGGTAFHLWYLPAAGFALVVVPFGLATVGVRTTGAICGLLALFALTFGAYHDVLNMPGQTRRGALLLAPSYVFIGYIIARWRPSLSTAKGAALAAAGLFAVVIEELFIANRTGEPFTSHDFLGSTFLFGVGVFLLARSLEAGRLITALAGAGALSLGIYVSHLLFLWAFRAAVPIDNLPLVFSAALTCFTCSGVLTFVLRRNRVLKSVLG